MALLFAPARQAVGAATVAVSFAVTAHDTTATLLVGSAPAFCTVRQG